MFFTIDAIVSVDYRVNPERGTQFRIWAMRVLLASTLQTQVLADDTVQAVQELIRGQVDTWHLLPENTPRIRFRPGFSILRDSYQECCYSPIPIRNVFTAT